MVFGNRKEPALGAASPCPFQENHLVDGKKQRKNGQPLRPKLFRPSQQEGFCKEARYHHCHPNIPHLGGQRCQRRMAPTRGQSILKKSSLGCRGTHSKGASHSLRSLHQVSLYVEAVTHNCTLGAESFAEVFVLTGSKLASVLCPGGEGLVYRWCKVAPTVPFNNQPPSKKD